MIALGTAGIIVLDGSELVNSDIAIIAINTDDECNCPVGPTNTSDDVIVFLEQQNVLSGRGVVNAGVIILADRQEIGLATTLIGTNARFVGE